jgi:hypothetical protein
MNKIIDFHHTLEEILQSIYCNEEMVGAPACAYSADGDVGPTIAGNPVAGFGFADNWAAGYDAAGVSVSVDILVNASMCCMFLQINVGILYILVNMTGGGDRGIQMVRMRLFKQCAACVCSYFSFF